MTDPDGIYPGQTWTRKIPFGGSVRITVVDGNRIGITRPYDHGATSYLGRRKFFATYTRPAA
ncbi:hypothetical protein ACGFZP_12855 [Kitasatospora sp. NPDC048239]|uniref:hypothetical protein n=1 Tax=Kitasatospora sp. NPDC048239 TaxID=3364046 RepID=UPI00371887F7